MKIVIVILAFAFLWWLSGLIMNKLLPKLIKWIAKRISRKKEGSGND